MSREVTVFTIPAVHSLPRRLSANYVVVEKDGDEPIAFFRYVGDAEEFMRRRNKLNPCSKVFLERVQE